MSCLHYQYSPATALRVQNKVSNRSFAGLFVMLLLYCSSRLQLGLGFPPLFVVYTTTNYGLLPTTSTHGGTSGTTKK